MQRGVWNLILEILIECKQRLNITRAPDELPLFRTVQNVKLLSLSAQVH